MLMFTLNPRYNAWGRTALVVGAALAALMATGAVQAQKKMYRCGSSYQDHPCAGDQPSKVIGQSGATLAASTPVDAACSARGVRSQKISWAREAGRTQQEQLDAMPHEAGLINEIYNQRGTAAVIRSAVEANCMAAKDRESQAAALESAAARLRQGDAPASAKAPVAPTAAPSAAPAATPTANVAPAAADEAARRRAESDAVSKKLRCSSLANRIRGLNDAMRRGASGIEMDRFKQQAQELSAAERDAGC